MRVCIFFDGKNFHSGWQNVANAPPIDFRRLVDWLVQRVGGTDLWGAYYYTGVETGGAAETVGQQKLSRFLNALEVLPGFFVKRFNRKSRILRCQTCHAENRFSQEKQVDTTMVADMLRLAAVNAFDVLILVSGDADLAPAVEGVQSLGRKVYVASWAGSGLSQMLHKVAFDHIDLQLGLAGFKGPSPAPAMGSIPVKPAATASAVRNQEQDTPATDSSRLPGDRSFPPATTSVRPDELVSSRSGSGQEIVSPQEGTARQQVASASTDTGTDAFLSELRVAECKFTGGYVGLNYFVTRWKSDRLVQSADIRRRILDRLVEQNKIEVYLAADGVKAIRTADTT
jgi:uncharacterized LabA/DUF88 family protein